MSGHVARKQRLRALEGRQPFLDAPGGDLRLRQQGVQHDDALVVRHQRLQDGNGLSRMIALHVRQGLTVLAPPAADRAY